MKTYKGEKYIYLAMAYALARQNKGVADIGRDNGYIGGYHYWRNFKIYTYQGKELLIETKTSKNYADYHRTFEVVSHHTSFGDIVFKDYINEYGENCAAHWTH